MWGEFFKVAKLKIKGYNFNISVLHEYGNSATVEPEKPINLHVQSFNPALILVFFIPCVRQHFLIKDLCN